MIQGVPNINDHRKKDQPAPFFFAYVTVFFTHGGMNFCLFSDHLGTVQGVLYRLPVPVPSLLHLDAFCVGYGRLHSPFEIKNFRRLMYLHPGVGAPDFVIQRGMDT